MNRLVSLALVPLLLAACRPSEQTEPPPETVQESPAEAAATAPDVVGTYRLAAVGDEPLPALAGQVDECALMLTGGTLRLGADARFDLALETRADCGDDELDPPAERVTHEGPYAVAGFDIRFGEETTRAGQPGDPESADATDETLLSAERFAGDGSIRDSVITLRTSDDLTTFTFVRE